MLTHTKHCRTLLKNLFSDATKIQTDEHDPTFTNLGSLQQYFRKLNKPNEILDELYKEFILKMQGLQELIAYPKYTNISSLLASSDQI